MVTEEKKVYSLNEAAEILNMSIPTLRRNIRNGTVPVLRFGERKIVVPVAALERMLENAGNGCSAK